MLNLLEREWVLYIANPYGTTSILKAIDKDKVAVARAYLSVNDKFNKKKGRGIAQSRMRNFWELYKNAGVVEYFSAPENNVYDMPGHILFEVVNPNKLFAEEKQFWENVILPRFDSK